MGITTRATRWLITGGCGFIGGNLVRELGASEANAIRIMDNESVCQLGDLIAVARRSRSSVERVRESDLGNWPENGNIQLYRRDILDKEACKRAAAGADVIVHLAANTGVAPSIINPTKDCHVNVLGTLNLLEAARASEIRRFIFASSGAPVGEVTPPITENVVPRPVSPYGASKLAGEGYCSAYFKTFDIETAILRFSNVYGPGSHKKESVVAKFIRQLLAGEKNEIFGDGSQTRDFLYVGDLVNAVVKASQAPGVGGETFQISTAIETNIRDLRELIAKALTDLGNDIADAVQAPRRQGDVVRNFADNSKARFYLGWSPQMDLESGLGETLRWFLDSPVSN